MSYPAIDGNTLAAYELDEQADGGLLAPIPGFVCPILDGFGIGDAPRFQAAVHNPPHFGGWLGFKNQVSGSTTSFLYDTLPSTTNHYGIGLPALFKPARAVGFFQGTATTDRDYIVLADGPTSNLKTMSGWVLPSQGIGATQIILQKAYQADAPTDGVLAGTFASPFYGAMQFFIGSTTDGSWGASINIAGTLTTVSITGNTSEHVRLRYGQWNHIGCTYDGAVFCIYCNGMLAASTPLSGAIDYGAGRWVVGAQSDNTISQLNGLVKRVRFESVAKPLSYFFDCYTNASGGAGGAPPVIS